MDIHSRVERLSESSDYRVVRFSAQWPMRYVGERNAAFGPEVDEGTPIEVHCHVDEDDGLDERDSRLLAIAEGREVWLCGDVMSRVRSQVQEMNALVRFLEVDLEEQWAMLDDEAC